MAQLDGVSSCKLKGHGYDSWSGHMTRLQVRSPVGAHMRQPISHRCFSHDVNSLSHQCFSPSLSLSLSLLSPLPSKINKHVPVRITKNKEVWGGLSTFKESIIKYVYKFWSLTRLWIERIALKTLILLQLLGRVIGRVINYNEKNTYFWKNLKKLQVYLQINNNQSDLRKRITEWGGLAG